MSKKFCAKDANKLVRECIGQELEDRDSVFAWMIDKIKESAALGADSLQFNIANRYTLEMLCELSCRGFMVQWLPPIDGDCEPSIIVSWEQDDE